jgi:hypothetical protein
MALLVVSDLAFYVRAARVAGAEAVAVAERLRGGSSRDAAAPPDPAAFEATVGLARRARYRPLAESSDRHRRARDHRTAGRPPGPRR